MAAAWTGVGADERHGPDDGFVVQVTGHWILVAAAGEDSAPCRNVGTVVRGQIVPTGCLFEAVEPDPGFAVQVARWDGSVDEISCAAPGSCGLPRSLPHSSVDSESLLSRLGSAGARLFSKRPKRYAITLARGPRLREAVLVLEGDAVDLSPAFAGAPADSYIVTLQPVTEDGPHAEPPPVSYAWKGESPVQSIGVDLTPGLYALVAASDAGPMECWVLLAAPADADSLRERFAQLEQISSAWMNSAAITEATRRGLLRATLDELAGT